MSLSILNDLVLTNHLVTLRRIKLSDYDALEKIVYDAEIWKYFVSRIITCDDLYNFLEYAIQDSLNGVRTVFVIIDNSTGNIVGSNAFGNYVKNEKRIEIGWSWLSMIARNTRINMASKLLLLDYAFDQLDCKRVEFKTDVLNTVARKALTKIGAYEEGILRSYNFMPGGRRRDVIYYSILHNEWQSIRNTNFSLLIENTTSLNQNN